MRTAQEIDLWANEVITTWKAQKVRFSKGATSKEIKEAEDKLGFIFPPAFHALYRRSNGCTECLPNVCSIWSLQRIIVEYPGSGGQNFVAFADFLIDSWFFGFKKNEAGVFRSIEMEESLVGDFMQAIDLINADSPLIY